MKFDARLAGRVALLPTDFDGRGALPSLEVGPCFAPRRVPNPIIRPGVCGDADDDTVLGGDGTDDLFGGPGIDRCGSDEAGTVAECERSAEQARQRCDEDVTIEGTAAGEVLIGTDEADVIDAGAGNDTIEGTAGDDLLCAGPGEDLALGGAGGDRVLGEGGRDQLLGGTGEDLVDGGDDDDGIGLGPVADTPDAERAGLPFGGTGGATLVVVALLAVAAGLIANGLRRRRSRRPSRRKTLSGSGAAG
ncbi:MAG: hypothetical protein H0U42_01085 [Thermoleophilaceae bacterium]|nr:hypothetical protein [Thermoleophilaceae bacterium]